jgi:hypothetical protein
MYKSNISKNITLVFGIITLVLIGGIFTEGSAQTRDPFAKPGYKQPKSNNPAPNNPSATNNSSPRSSAAKPEAPAKPSGPVIVEAPPIQDRIDYYYRIREEAAVNGQPIPKVTSVLLLNEMTVSGIFKTPRGYAALVEAKPINLSYTIYPGEKFFDGQLVAVEENRLVFRKVNKLSSGKFVSTVENKPLRKYSLQQELQQGAVPPDAITNTEIANSGLPGETEKQQIIISPLDEMNMKAGEDTEESAKEKKDEKGKKGKKDKKDSSKRKSIAKNN